MAKVIDCDLDTLLSLSHYYFGPHGACLQCGAPLGGLGGSAPCCPSCSAARYCSGACGNAHAATHASHCALCAELCDVLRIDADRWAAYVPFR